MTEERSRFLNLSERPDSDLASLDHRDATTKRPDSNLASLAHRDAQSGSKKRLLA
jgi:hypothetical protein